jgi:hypothetical protein
VPSSCSKQRHTDTTAQNSASSYTKPKRSSTTYSRPSTTIATAGSPKMSCARLCGLPDLLFPIATSTNSFQKWIPIMTGPLVLKNGGTYSVNSIITRRLARPSLDHEMTWWKREHPKTIRLLDRCLSYTMKRSRDAHRHRNELSRHRTDC